MILKTAFVFSKCVGFDIFKSEQSSVVGRLKSNINFWRAIGCSKVVLDWIENGINLRFVSAPSPRIFPNRLFNDKQNDFIQKEINALLVSGAIQRASSTPVIVSAINAVPKKTGDKLRLVVNLRHINSFLPHRVFKYENLRRVGGDILQKGVWLFKVDLKSGYHHIQMHGSTHRFLGFQFNNQFFEFKVLPFGLSLAPFIFTKVTKQLLKLWRSEGIRVMGYIDDFLFVADSLEEARALSIRIQIDLWLSGFVKSEKSELEPKQLIEFLGYLINSRVGEYQVPEEKISAIIEFLSSISNKKTVCVRDLAKAAGLILSLSLALQPARMFTRSFYRLIGIRTNWFERVFWSEEARSDCMWWVNNLRNWSGRTIWVHQQKFELFIQCDASSYGYGGRFSEETVQGVWGELEVNNSINWKELSAVERILQKFSTKISDKSILIRSDNSTTVAYLNNGGGRVHALNSISRNIWTICVNCRCNLFAEWVSGENNQEADFLSRIFEWNNFRMSVEFFSFINMTWGPFTVDRMASHLNHQLPRYNSKSFDSNAEATDCFTQSWAGEMNWVFPDFNLISNVLQHMKSCGAVGAVVIPKWESQSWWPIVLNCAKDWVYIPREKILLDHCHSSNRLPNGEIFAILVDFRK